MQKTSFGRLALLGLLAMALAGAGCHHAQQPATAQTPAETAPPPSPVAARPTVTLEASSTFIQQGESATLTWTSTNATSLTLTPSVGTVAAQGSQKVTPTDSTTYTITATGPGGQATQSLRISVGAANVPQPTPTTGEVPFTTGVHDAYFDYNKSDLRPDAREALSQTAQYLRQHPEIHAIIEGHCDERGSEEYNIGLGQRRADAVKEFLASLGISADRLSTVSYGKEKPFCTAHDETCWQQNRVGHFVRAQ
jgi:peptidoglycan-associated lipoprotein